MCRPGSSLFARVRDGVCYASEQSERTVRRHRYDTIADGVGLDRVTANFARAVCDDAIRVKDADALVMAHFLLRFEGLFLGSSSALNCVAAIRAAHELRPKSPAFRKHVSSWAKAANATRHAEARLLSSAPNLPRVFGVDSPRWRAVGERSRVPEPLRIRSSQYASPAPSVRPREKERERD